MTQENVYVLVDPSRDAAVAAFTSAESAEMYGQDLDDGVAWQIREVPWLDDYRLIATQRRRTPAAN